MLAARKKKFAFSRNNFRFSFVYQGERRMKPPAKEEETMKYAAILLSLLFAMTAPPLSGSPAEEAVPELLDTAGIVLEIAEDALTLNTETHGEVVVHLTDETLFEGETPVVGAYVHVVNNGAMTMSLPPQITALRVGCYAFTGTVSGIGEESFMLQTESGEYQVNVEAEKLADLSEGASVTVYSNGAMTMSIPAQIYGELIVAAE